MFPKFIGPYLWFSDIRKIDIDKDYQRIILNVLNIGSKEATDWLFKIYSKVKIKKVIKLYGAKELSLKSFNYWILILDVNKKEAVKKRF